jgi:hypothetical protein
MPDLLRSATGTKTISPKRWPADSDSWTGLDSPSMRTDLKIVRADMQWTLTTKPDHNRIRQGPIPADALRAAVPGERLYPTT